LRREDATSRASKAKVDRHQEDVYPWDRARGQTNKCCYCKADCVWVVCKECSDLIAQGKPPRTPTYRPSKKGLIRRHTFGGEVR
jgi:hypothetical protein